MRRSSREPKPEEAKPIEKGPDPVRGLAPLLPGPLPPDLSVLASCRTRLPSAPIICAMLPATPTPDFRSPAFLRAHIADTMAFYEGRCVDPSGGLYQFFKDDGSVYD